MNDTLKIQKLLPLKAGMLFFFFSSHLLFAYENSPVRIISLGPYITRMLYILEAQDKLIANTMYCPDPPEGKKEKIGTLIDVDIERIVLLKPDLVLATGLTNPSQIKKLKNLGINVITFPAPGSFDEMCEHLLKLGKLIGKEEKAEEILRDVRRRVELIKEKGRKKVNKPKVLIQVGDKPLWVAGKKSFINDFITFAGGENIGPESEFALCSREEVLKKNPDVIIIASMGIGEEEKKMWQKYRSIKAVRNNRIYIMDADELCSANPLTFVPTLEKLFKILYPQDEQKGN